jgi:hypothetical protein
MQRSATNGSTGSWQASIQIHTQPGTAWRRHIAAIATYIDAFIMAKNHQRLKACKK